MLDSFHKKNGLQGCIPLRNDGTNDLPASVQSLICFIQHLLCDCRLMYVALSNFFKILLQELRSHLFTKKLFYIVCGLDVQESFPFFVTSSAQTCRTGTRFVITWGKGEDVGNSIVLGEEW